MSLSFLLKSFSNETKPQKKKKKAEPDVAALLQRERLRLKRTKNPRPASPNFNPSSITWGYCARSKVAQLAGIQEIYVDIPTPKEQLNFDVGHKIHDLIQGYFWDCGLLRGNFYCIRCKKNWYCTSPKGCPWRKSHTRADLKFREIPMKDIVYKISGRADGIVLVEWQKQIQEHLLEIKSIGNRVASSVEKQVCFEDLIEPKHDHVVQANLYMMMLKIQQAHIFYVGKNSLQIKSYYIEYDPKILTPYLLQISEMLEWAESIKSGERKDLPQPCSNKKCLCEEIVLSSK